MSLLDAAANALIGDLAANYVLITPANRYIGTIVPDVTVREVHIDEDTITVHPVETGTPISDHVFANPKNLEIACGFSDSTAGYPGYVQVVYESFLALKATRTPFDVSTGKRLYSNMLIRNLTVVTDETSEFALMVTVQLQEVIITSTDGGSGPSQATQANPADTAPETNVGNQTLQLSSVSSGIDPSTGFAAPISMATSVPSGLDPSSGFGAVPLT